MREGEARDMNRGNLPRCTTEIRPLARSILFLADIRTTYGRAEMIKILTNSLFVRGLSLACQSEPAMAFNRPYPLSRLAIQMKRSNPSFTMLLISLSSFQIRPEPYSNCCGSQPTCCYLKSMHCLLFIWTGPALPAGSHFGPLG